MMRKYKIIKFLVCLVFLVCAAGCQKLFKEDTQNKLQLRTLSDYNEAMAGLYNSLFNGIMGNTLIYLTSIANEDDMSVMPHNDSREDLDDDCGFSLNSDIEHYVKCNGSQGSTPNDYSYLSKLMYQTVGIANDILSIAGDINKLRPDFKKIVGEVYFIRAYVYYRMVRLYGSVPVVENTDVEFSTENTPITDIYDFIESDLKKAIDLLPATNDGARIKFETPFRGTAKALMAEVYLTMGGVLVNDPGKYEKAAGMAKEVIDSSVFYGLGLMPDLADLWNGEHKHNPEAIFAIHILDASKDISNGIDAFNNELFTFTGTGGLGFYNNSLCRNYNYVCVAPVFYNSFPKNYRKEVSFQTRHVPNNNPRPYFDPVTHIRKIHYDSLYLKHYDTINYSTDIAYRKFYTQFSVPDSVLLEGSYMNPSVYGHYTGGVVYLFRYAQTLLTYAEAKARIGEVDASVYEAINQVRRRANKISLSSSSPFDLQPGLSQMQFLDSVIQERAWELCAEPEGRWFDIMRLGLTGTLVAVKQKQKIIVYPIPTSKNNFYLPLPAK